MRMNKSSELVTHEQRMAALKAAFKEMCFDAPLTYDQQEMTATLATQLEPGERILWSACPDVETVAKNHGRGLAIALFVIFAILVTVIPDVIAKFVFGTLGLLCIPWAIKAPEWARETARRTLYAVTTERVIEMMGTKAKRAGELARWYVKRHNKGDLVEPKLQAVNYKLNIADIIVAEGEDSDGCKTVQKLVGVRDPQQAVAALNKVRKKHSSLQ